MSAVKINFYGQLGNRILIYLMAQYFTEKHNLKFNISIDDQHLNEYFDILCYSGNNEYENFVTINDDNVVQMLQLDKIESNILFDGFFQSPEILSNFDIINKYKKYIKPKKVNHDFDLFVHVRLGDITNRYSLPYEYYDNTLKNIKFKNGIISSDTPNHPIIINLINKYNLKLFNDTPAKTIQFGCHSKNIVLSGGTFSFLTALYSNNSNIFYIDNPSMYEYFNIKPWGPDIFSIFNNNSIFKGERNAYRHR